jgi:hypothetical protein
MGYALRGAGYALRGAGHSRQAKKTGKRLWRYEIMNLEGL